jgi:hypothetical protein
MTKTVIEQANALFSREYARLDAVSMSTLGIPTSCAGITLKPLSAGRLFALQYIESAFVIPKELKTDIEMQNEILKALFVLTSEPADLHFLMLCVEYKMQAEKYEREQKEFGLKIALEQVGKYQAIHDAKLVSFGDSIGLLNPVLAQEILQTYIDSSFRAYELLSSGGDSDSDSKKNLIGKAFGATGRC